MNTNLTRSFLTYKVSVHWRQFHKKLKLPAQTKKYVEIKVATLYLDKLDYSIWDCCFAESSEIFNDITCLEQKGQKSKKTQRILFAKDIIHSQDSFGRNHHMAV